MYLLGLLCSAMVASSSQPIAIEDFETPGSAERWAFSNGPEFPGAEGEFAVVPEAARSGGGGGRLRFDFSGGGNYVQATIPLPPDSNLRWINLWVKKTVPNRMTFRCVDAQNETFQKAFNFPNTDWQHIRVNLRTWSAHWGEGGNGIFDEPPRAFGILVVKGDGIEEGEVDFDDITGEEDEEGQAGTAEYVLNLPLPSDQSAWRMRVQGPPDAARWDGSKLQIDFPKGVRSVSLTTHHSLLGDPRELRLFASSPGTDIFATVVVYSHFQRFERRILIPRSHSDVSVSRSGLGGVVTIQTGNTDLPDPKAIPVPMGAMEGWDHSRGQNDGVVRPPLRLVEIRLEAPDGAPATEITFHDLKLHTWAEPGEEFILYGRGRLVDDDRAEFRLLGRTLLDRDLKLSVPYIVSSYDGRTLRKGKTRFVLRGGGEPSETKVQVPIGDEPFARAEFTVRLPLLPERRVVANVTRPFPPAVNPEQDSDSMFGMGLYFYRYPATEQGFAEMDAAAGMAAAAGVKWSREEFNWGRIEPVRGEYSWEFYDRMVDTAARHGISIYGLLAYWAPWTEPFTDEGIADYCRFVSAVVGRYRGKIQHWEVWNEPNIFFWSGPKEVYSRLLREAHRTIKETDPNAKVLGCSTAGIDMGFVRQVVSEGAPFDILTIHPYRRDLDEVGFIRELKNAKDEVSDLMGRDTPVWITEMGWPTQVGGITEWEAASNLSRVYVCAAASGAVGNVSWYDFRNDADDPLYHEANFGVLYRDMTPKPAYRALGTVCRNLAAQRVARELDWGDGSLAYLFEGNQKKTIAVWSLAGGRLITLRKQGAKAIKAANMVGEPAVSITIGDGVSFWLMEKSPIFLEVDKVPKVVANPLELVVEPGTVQPGDVVTIKYEVDEAFEKRLEIDWRQSYGWRSKRAERRYDDTVVRALSLKVPDSAIPGPKKVGFSLGYGRSRLNGWISFHVVPQTLEI